MCAHASDNTEPPGSSVGRAFETLPEGETKL